jgi:FtsH-binding integral membrane protein
MQNASSEIKAGEFVTKNVGLHKFVTRIYNTTGLSILGALGGAWAGMSIPMLMMNPMATAIVGGIATIASFVGVQAMSPRPVV